MSMTQELPRLRQDVGENLIAQMDALLPPTDPTKPFVDRGDGLKFVRFRGRFAQYEDDGTWEIPDSFWWTMIPAGGSETRMPSVQPGIAISMF